jgi:hypothetical protein
MRQAPKTSLQLKNSPKGLFLSIKSASRPIFTGGASYQNNSARQPREAWPTEQSSSRACLYVCLRLYANGKLVDVLPEN